MTRSQDRFTQTLVNALRAFDHQVVVAAASAHDDMAKTYDEVRDASFTMAGASLTCAILRLVADNALSQHDAADRMLEQTAAMTSTSQTRRKVRQLRLLIADARRRAMLAHRCMDALLNRSRHYNETTTCDSCGLLHVSGETIRTANIGTTDSFDSFSMCVLCEHASGNRELVESMGFGGDDHA